MSEHEGRERVHARLSETDVEHEFARGRIEADEIERTKGKVAVDKLRAKCAGSASDASHVTDGADCPNLELGQSSPARRLQ